MNLTSKTPGQRLASHTNTRRLTKQTTRREEASTYSLGRNGMLSGLLNESLPQPEKELLAQENKHLRLSLPMEYDQKQLGISLQRWLKANRPTGLAPRFLLSQLYPFLFQAKSLRLLLIQLEFATEPISGTGTEVKALVWVRGDPESYIRSCALLSLSLSPISQKQW
ncbi:hypothetical protein ACFE04_011448 [Oxalis oulophora]